MNDAQIGGLIGIAIIGLIGYLVYRAGKNKKKSSTGVNVGGGGRPSDRPNQQQQK